MKLHLIVFLVILFPVTGLPDGLLDDRTVLAPELSVFPRKFFIQRTRTWRSSRVLSKKSSTLSDRRKIVEITIRDTRSFKIRFKVERS